MRTLAWFFFFLLTIISVRAESLRIFAAASMTEVLQEVARSYNAKEKLVFNFDASSKLAHQINSGAPADLFFSADTDWMEFLLKNRRIIAATRKDLLSNRIVLVVPKDSKLLPQQVSDLLNADYARIALAGEAVPAGKFARAALQHQGVKLVDLKSKIASADNVKVALKWVALKEAQAGIVYVTDAMVDKGVTVAFTFPEESHPKIIYPAGILKQSKNQTEAQNFLAFCQSAEAKKIFEKAGFKTL